MAKKTTASTAEDKLRALYDLQLIDSRIDRIRVVRGELPLEVEDLEDEIAGLRTRLERLEEDLDLVNQRISAYKIQIEDSKALIAKYTEQQNNVRNNREFESLNKEIEYQTLEIASSRRLLQLGSGLTDSRRWCFFPPSLVLRVAGSERQYRPCFPASPQALLSSW